MADNEPARDEALARLSDAELEVIRRRAAVDRDNDLLEACVQRLILRGAAALVAKCRQLGDASELDEERINLAVEEATRRFIAALGRRNRLPTVLRFAAQTASECIDAQLGRPAPGRPKLMPRKPNLRPLDGDDERFEPRSNGRRKL